MMMTSKPMQMVTMTRKLEEFMLMLTWYFNIHKVFNSSSSVSCSAGDIAICTHIGWVVQEQNTTAVQ
jgi:hypothetical protein